MKSSAISLGSSLLFIIILAQPFQRKMTSSFRQAMDWFEKAEEIRPAGNDEVILRWNGCARIIMNNKLEPREMADDFIE